VAQPEDGLSPRGDWWTLFGDEQLNRLEEQLQRENPTLQAAAEVYTQARDLAAEAQSHLYPQIGAQALVSDNRESAHHLFSTANVPAGSLQRHRGGRLLGAGFLGRHPQSYPRAEALAQASAADLATARLSLEAELANDYIAVRGYDAELEVLRQSIIAYQKAVEVARLRSQGKIASGLDSRASLESARFRASPGDRDASCSAISCSTPSRCWWGQCRVASRSQPVKEFTLTPPQVPAGVPSELLQRRPDIASAERQMAAANAEIGVSRAAFYPNITLSAGAGFEDNAFNLLSLPNSLWSVGAGAMLPLFEGGLRRAELQRSWSQYAQTRDGYRSTVLASFQEVEDGLSLTQRLGDGGDATARGERSGPAGACPSRRCCTRTDSTTT
jgi:multidrug efflux system outer membrane protein